MNRFIVLISSIIAITSVLTNFVTVSVVSQPDQKTVVPTRGSLYLLAVLWIIYIGVHTISILVKTLKSAAGKLKNQLNFILIGYFVAFVFAVSSTVIIPNLRGNSSLNNYSLFSSLFLSIFIGYSIIRQGFLNIKIHVMRAVSHVLFSIVVFLLYLWLATAALTSFVEDFDSFSSTLLFFASAMLLIYVTNFLRIYIDRATNKIFYRDAYDTREELDKLSKAAISKFKVDELVSESLNILGKSLKPYASSFIVLNEDGEFYSNYDSGKGFELNQITLIEQLADQGTQVLLQDDTLEFTNLDNKKSDISKYLTDKNIYLSVQLRAKNEIVGYMLFGPKLSGNLYSKQDIQLVSIAANELAIAIQNARRFDEISRFNETLKLEIERATNELKSSNEKLQALDQAKDEFISMASHQLRTPLTSVKGYLSMVLGGDVGKIDKQQKEMILAAFNSSQRMVYLISDLLNVSRLQTGKFVIEPVLTNLPMVVESELDQLKETFKTKDIKFAFKKPKNFPEIYIDETKTRQVIMNFIDNAIYYTPVGGKIEVSLNADDKKIELRVKDNGIGVPKEERHNLFTKFYRASNAKKARPDGTGLGLYMAKKVILDQGGAVIFDSVENKGSTFGFTFPLTRVSPPKKLFKKSDAQLKKVTKAKTK